MGLSRMSNRFLILLSICGLFLLTLYISKFHEIQVTHVPTKLHLNNDRIHRLQSVNNVKNQVRPSHQSRELGNVLVNLLAESNPLGSDGTVDFRQCRMFNCFNFSRCNPNGPLRVSIKPGSSASRASLQDLGESNLVHRNILKIIRESEYYEPDPDKACLLVPEDDTLDRDPLSPSFKADFKNLFGPKNDYGMNYLVFNLYSGTWPEYHENDFSGLNFGAAILAKASNSLSHHRPRFDISLPLFSYMHPVSQDRNSSLDLNSKSYSRRNIYFLTFKGKRYVFGRGSETRNNLHHINNDRDIVMLTTCRHGKKWRESSDDRCFDDETNYDKYDFNDLMINSKFCLTPRGRRLGSFRFLESLGSGCIPVILSDGWVDPFDEIIDWSTASIHLPESLLLQVPDMLRDISPETYKLMSYKCLKLYEKHFSSMEKIISTTLSIIENRIKNQIKLE